MNFLLFVINFLIISLLAEKKSVFRSDEVLENENNPNRSTIYGKFMVFFDNNCTADKNSEGIDIIQEFLDLFECYTLNPNVTDQYPDIVDHWIYMDKQQECDYEDDVELEWDDYCIRNVEEDEEEHAYAINQCLSRPVESALWNLNTVSPGIKDGTQFIQFDSTYNPNMDIIIMDGGIDASHSQFDGITIERIFDAYPGEALGSHGTHVAGTVVGKDYGAFRIDSDTEIKLIDVRIFPTSGGTSSTTILNAYDSIINYLSQNLGKKAIINMSFGGGNSDEKYARLGEIRYYGGISIAAAGNDGSDASVKSPASSADTITVGNHDSTIKRNSATCTDDDGDDYDCSSNYGNVVDIWAPGTSILSALPGGGNGYKTGTSMASPLVAGIAANILANNPGLDFYGIKQRLLDYAVYDIDDRNGNTNLPRVQVSCEEYGYIPTFTLRPTSDYGDCLDVAYSNNDNVLVYPCHFGSNQKWKRGTPDSDGYYAIISLYNNECLDAAREDNGIVDSGDNIYTYPCHYADNQLWKIDGGIIRNKENGRAQCLDTGDHDDNVHIWSCDYNNGYQQVGFVEETEIKSIYYSGHCLDVAYSSGDNVYLYPCHGGLNQKWRRGITDSDGYYTLISEYNQECLDIDREGNNIVDTGDNIYTYPCHGGDNQLWKIDGILIKSKANGGNWCLDGGDHDDNAHIWECSSSNGNQQFEFPGFSSLTGSAARRLVGYSMADFMEDSESMPKDQLTVYNEKYLIFGGIGVLLIMNMLCFIIYCCCKRNDESKEGNKYIDLENPNLTNHCN